jgi:hypothetical protein
LGSLFGLGLGLGLVAFLEFRDSSFRSQDDVTSVLALPVLAQIPIIVTVRRTAQDWPPPSNGSLRNGGDLRGGRSGGVEAWHLEWITQYERGILACMKHFSG